MSIRNMHPSEEVLERYSLGQLTEAECAPFEDHLLVCDDCQQRLSRIDAEIADIKQVCRDIPPSIEPEHSGFFARLFHAAPVWAAVAAALVIGVAVPVYRQATGTRGVSDVVLEAARGAAPIAEARAGARLKLTVDLAGLSAPGPYRIEIVSAGGQRVWNAATASSDRTIVNGPEGLEAGSYWVRIYAAGGAIVREYGLHLN
jgi:hypothetical protein